MRLEGKVALMSGASCGLGQRVALGLAAEGADVVIDVVIAARTEEENPRLRQARCDTILPRQLPSSICLVYRPWKCSTLMSTPVNWMLVSSAENFEISRGMGFTLAGMKSRHRKKAEKVKAGDRVVFYLTGIQAIGGIATVTGPYFEDHDDLWHSKKEGEGYPFRFPVAPHLVLAAKDFVPIVGLVPHMVYPKRWPEAHWRLAFQGNVHVLSDEDYALIESAVQNAASATAGVR